MERLKIIFIIALAIFFCLDASAQQYTPMTAAGYQMKRIKADSTLHIPSFCGIPSLRNSTAKDGAIAMDTCNNKLYKWTNQAGWSEITGGSGGGGGTVTEIQTGYGINGGPITGVGTLTADTATLSTKYLRISDYSAFDSTSISNRINLKLNISDSANMLSPYLRKTDTANQWVSSVTQPSSSIIRVVKGSTTTDLTIGGSTSISDTAKVVIAKVHNAETTTLTRGTVVYLYGSNGDVASVKRANNKSDVTSSKTFGFVRADIASGDTGYVTTQGQIDKLNLGAYTSGDVLWLDSLDGQFTKNKPSAPYHLVFLGVVERANNGNGLVYTKPQNGYELDEIHNVAISGIINNNILVYSDTQSLWKNRSIYSVVDTANKIATKSNVNLKVNIADTSTMLTNYPRGTGSTNTIPYWISSRTLSSNSNFTIDPSGPNIFVSTTGLKSNITPLYISHSATGIGIDAYAQLSTSALNIPRVFIHDGNNSQEAILNANKLSFTTTSSGTLSIVAPAPINSNRTINIQDASGTLMLQGDTVSLSNRINLKANLSQGTYSFLANNTNATANMASTPFKDVSGSYTGTLTWTGGTAPTGLTNATYQYTQIGKQVTLRIHLQYTSAGTSNTRIQIPFISDFPTPVVPTGLSSTTDVLYYGTGVFGNSKINYTSAANAIVFLRGTGSGSEIVIDRAAAAGQYVYATIQYFTNATY